MNVRDITERKRADEKLRSSQQGLRKLSAQLQKVREEEKTIIAREIHDELGQALTALKMDVSWIGSHLSAQRPLPEGQAANAANLQALRKKTLSMASLIDDTIQTVRKISTALRPAVLDDLGLTAAIEWQAEEFQSRTGIRCTVTSTLPEAHLERDSSTGLFRIFQETLTNVACHANATTVEVSLRQENSELVLTIRDNGTGIPQEKVYSPKSLGLLGIRERALLLGGRVAIGKGPRKGTVVNVRIPVAG